VVSAVLRFGANGEDYSAHLAPVAPILRRPEGFRLDGLNLKIRVKLDDGGIEAFEVESHLLKGLMGPFDIVGHFGPTLHSRVKVSLLPNATKAETHYHRPWQWAASWSQVSRQTGSWGNGSWLSPGRHW
jgi:hypothetical protein